MSRRTALHTLALSAFLATAASAHAQQGIITGRVTDSLTREPVAAAQVRKSGVAD